MYRTRFCVFFLTVFATSGCGIFHAGDVTPNETGPSGAVALASGSLAGFYGQTASGNVTVYYDGGTSYITHLEGASLPQQTGMLIQTVASTGTVDSEPVVYYAGNQNYYFTVTGSQPTFTQVNIYSPTANLNYAQANLLSP
jgi:hypothetical protein